MGPMAAGPFAPPRMVPSSGTVLASCTSIATNRGEKPPAPPVLYYPMEPGECGKPAVPQFPQSKP